MKRVLKFFNPLHLAGAALWIGLIGLGVAGYFLVIDRRPDMMYQMKVSTGKFVDPPKRITTVIESRARQHNLLIEFVDVEGSEDSFDKVQNGDIDMAVVKGGIALAGRDNIRQVSILDIEAFHLLVKRELYDAVLKDFGALRGKRININKPATGTHHWSLDILKFAGLEPKSAKGQGNYTALGFANPDLLKYLALIEETEGTEKERFIDDLPDAILLAEPIPSPIARKLVAMAGYRLAPLPFGPAYIQARHGAAGSEFLDSAAVIELVTIPAFSYSVSPATPPESCSTIGLRRVLIANRNLDSQAVVRCLRLLYDHPPDPALDLLDWSKVQPEYELHDGVPIYDSERKHVVQNTLIRLGERLASVMGGLVGAILAIYGYFRYRRLLRFEHYFHEIRTIDLVARGKTVDPAAPTDRARLIPYLQNKLAELRNSAIAEFAQGRLQGENLILSIFTLIQDTNMSLASLAVPAGAAKTEKRI